MHFRARSTPLAATGPGPAIGWCAALVAATLITDAPAALGFITLTVLVAAVAAQITAPFRRVLRWAVVLGLSVCVINTLVSQQGTTILWHFGDLPVLGVRYITAQAVGGGALLGLRATTLVLIGALYSLAVDPDAVLELTRRWSFRSALTATIATRMMPLLLRDAGRLADAQRTRSGPPPGRVALLAATTGGLLDRALDVAAALEVRGFGLDGPRTRRRRLRNRHDRAFVTAAGAVSLLAIVARLWSPWLEAAVGPLALAPFLDRRGIT